MEHEAGSQRRQIAGEQRRGCHHSIVGAVRIIRGSVCCGVACHGFPSA